VDRKSFCTPLQVLTTVFRTIYSFITYSDTASMDVEVVCPSPDPVITMGSGLFLGAMTDVWKTLQSLGQ